MRLTKVVEFETPFNLLIGDLYLDRTVKLQSIRVRNDVGFEIELPASFRRDGFMLTPGDTVFERAKLNYSDNYISCNGHIDLRYGEGIIYASECVIDDVTYKPISATLSYNLFSTDIDTFGIPKTMRHCEVEPGKEFSLITDNELLLNQLSIRSIKFGDDSVILEKMPESSFYAKQKYPDGLYVDGTLREPDTQVSWHGKISKSTGIGKIAVACIHKGEFVDVDKLIIEYNVKNKA